jgi:putative ABC transport system permease protein
MEVVLGSDVARASGLAAGASFSGSHGLGGGGGEHGDAPYRVVGVLGPTGGTIDRLVLTSIESVWRVHEQHGPDESHDADAKSHDPSPPGATTSTTESAREVTLALVSYASPLAAASLPRAINAETVLQAASPAYESARLLTVFGVGTDVIRGFALLLIASAAMGLFVALTQALDERRYDLAIMRALGAPRGTLVAVLLVESVLLSATGLVVGLVLAHAFASGVGWWLPAAASLAAGAWVWQPEEWAIVALALGAGIIATLLPAWRTYRLDVAATLADQ